MYLSVCTACPSLSALYCAGGPAICPDITQLLQQILARASLLVQAFALTTSLQLARLGLSVHSRGTEPSSTVM